MNSGTPPSTFRLPPRRRPAKSAERLAAMPDQLRGAADPWCGGWMAHSLHTLPANAQAKGLELIEAGVVLRFEMHPGLVTASVLLPDTVGRADVTIRVDTVPKDGWHVIAAAIARDAGSAASISADRLPENLSERMARLGFGAWPERHEYTCTCARPDGCEHVAAVDWLVADRIFGDPTRALALRGIDPVEFVAAVRQSRTVHARGRVSAHPEQAPSGEPPAALESRVDDFWQCDPCIHELEQLPAPAHAHHALLRRLGPPPLKGRFPLLGLLASVYDTVTEAATRLRDEDAEVDEVQAD